VLKKYLEERNLKKVIAVLLTMVLMVGVLAGCSSDTSVDTGGTVESGEGTVQEAEIVLRLADVWNEGYPAMYGNIEFKRVVEEMSNGRIVVEIYGGGQLGDEKETIEQVQFGALDMTRISISPLTEFYKPLSVLILPYIYRDTEHMFSVLDGEIGDELAEGLTEEGFVPLAWYDAGSRSFYNSIKEVHTIDDLAGMKIRVQESEMMMGMVEAVGASATPMAFTEVYSALQTGVIDGAENNFPSYKDTSHYEVAKYYTLDEHTKAPELIVMSTITYDKLSDEDKEIIAKAGIAAEIVEREKWEEYESECREVVEAAGTIITTIDAPTKQEFQDAVKPLYTAYDEYSELIDRIIATE
jgi:tripartite ATP-independent transporter DctP family solute receptor